MMMCTSTATISRITVNTGTPVHFAPPSGGNGKLVRKRPCASQVKAGWVITPMGFSFWRQQEGNTGERRQRTQGSDGWVYPQIGDDQTVDHAGEHAGYNACQHGDGHVAGGQDVKRSHRSYANQHRSRHYRADRGNRNPPRCRGRRR